MQIRLLARALFGVEKLLGLLVAHEVLLSNELQRALVVASASANSSVAASCPSTGLNAVTIPILRSTYVCSCFGFNAVPSMRLLRRARTVLMMRVRHSKIASPTTGS